ncbi:PREDICTED: putative clathrin assembly protein At1g68110 [Camelina sativa]|uniref:Clathrin assembly protein At1g68110 n=1 Tax=Camelina sativa TaxID=90675 RepID=A0ABM0WGF3_CAMSA|nr:PREDICTED: putative clathrin assembly protein At1g68110 [Camelina sativa]
MMKLWKRAAAAIKDRKSLLAVGFSRRSSSSYRNADLEAAIIKATSHDDTSVDYSNAHRVYKWIRSSPLNLKTLINALSTRVNHTRSWIVALKSLMLLHGVLCTKVPSVVGEIRRLPFDLSGFSDGHSCLSKTWGFNIFVRTYFAFLHNYSSFLSDQIHRFRNNRTKSSEKGEKVIQDLETIQKLQSLLDMILQIKPIADNMKKTLILEAMDCLVIESINIFGRIRSGIIKILPLAGKTEAATVLKIVHKATSQGEDLTIYFDFCKGFGVPNARETPQFVCIPEEEVEGIEEMIEKPKPEKEEEVEVEDEKAMVVLEQPGKLQTIITDKWEIFEDDYRCFNRKEDEYHQNHLPLIVTKQPVYINYTMPDLITF